MASLNKKLASVEWGKYKLEDLFTIEGTKSLDSNAITFEKEGINIIGRTFENNGIQGKISKRNFEPNKPFTITATVIGNYKYVKYQKEPYYCSQNINKLTPKNLKVWNERIAYFFVTNIQKFVSLYNHQQGGYKLEDIKNHIISLPIKNNEIDFDFMESYIRELEEDRIRELSAYLKVSGFDNYELSNIEKQAIQNITTLNWREVKITDIFNVKNTRNILSSKISANSGNTPYLCASADNNSVSSYIDYKENMKDKGNCVFIGGKTFVVSYQELDFFSNDSHNLALYLKDKDKANKINQLYLATCVRKSLSHKYSWGNSISNKKIQDDMVTVPIKNGAVDYGMMNVLITAVQKLVVKDVVLYADSKINASKQIVNRK